MELKIVFKDDNYLIIDKPIGVASHPAKGFSGADVWSIVKDAGYFDNEWLSADSGTGENYLGIVSRLDSTTSGIMIIARNEQSYRYLQQLFKDREVQKTYYAVVQGYPKVEKGIIDAPIRRRDGNDFRQGVFQDGRPSMTKYIVEQKLNLCSLVKVLPKTGRTHQIRVHLSSINHPIVGDTTYGANPVIATELGITRIMLHAKALEFFDKFSNKQLQFQVDLPVEFKNLLN
jgi:23S rRNA pseudouridine1911/1915/1917 synthase